VGGQFSWAYIENTYRNRSAATMVRELSDLGLFLNNWTSKTLSHGSGIVVWPRIGVINSELVVFCSGQEAKLAHVLRPAVK